MFDDIAEITESCANCWWSSSRQPDYKNETVYCALVKLYQAPYMWCEKWRDRFTRAEGVKK